MNNDDLVKEIDAALVAHAQWKMKLTNAINIGKCDAGVDVIACDDQCAFGKWLHGPTIDASLKDGKPYQVTRRLHAEFHKSAATIAALAEEGAKGEAYAKMDGEYSMISDKLTRALQKWRGEVTG